MSDGKMVTCANCGNERPEGTRFCGVCGTPFAQADQPASPAEPPPTSSSTRGRRPVWVAAGAVAALLVAGGAIAAVLSSTGGDGSTQATPTEVVDEFSTDTTESDPFGYTTDEATDDGYPGVDSAESSTDCTRLVDALSELVGIDSYEGSDYLSARDFLDDYADRAPEEIRDSVRTLRDFLDDFASAAEDAGLEPGEGPLPDQVDQLRAAVDLSSDEQEALGSSFETVTTWSDSEC